MLTFGPANGPAASAAEAASKKDVEHSAEVKSDEQVEAQSSSAADSNKTKSGLNAKKAISYNDKHDRERDPEQSWMKKIWTDPVAIFTGLLFFATLALWYSTFRLGVGTDDTSRRQLRAYIAVDRIWFVSCREMTQQMPENTQPLTISPFTDDLMVSIANYGQTPAHDVEIWHESTNNIGDDFAYPFKGPYPMVAPQMLHPTQINKICLESGGRRIRFNTQFYVYGRILYRDIYDRWWRTTFSYSHENNSRFEPDGKYNKESGPYKGRDEALSA